LLSRKRVKQRNVKNEYFTIFSCCHFLCDFTEKTATCITLYVCYSRTWSFLRFAIFFLVYMPLTGEATLFPDILNVDRKFARISKFLSTKPNKHKTKSRDLSTTSPVCFQIVLCQSENFTDFRKVFFSNRFSQHHRTVEPVPLHLPHVFRTGQILNM